MPDEMNPQTTEEEEQLYSLEDVDIETLGLVGVGAVGENFFLLKSKDGKEQPMDLEQLQKEIEATGDDRKPNLFERWGIQRLFELAKRGQAAEAAETEAAIQQEPTPDDESEEEQPLPSDAENTQKDTDDEVESVMSKKDEQENVAVEDQPTPTADTQPEPTTDETVAAEVAKRDEQITELMARLEKAETANQSVVTRLEKAEAEVEKARQVAQAEREARERLVYIEKANDYSNLPVKADELGELLHWLAKQDAVANVEKAADAEDRSDRLGYVTELLRAANEQLTQAGFFIEKGTSQMPKNGTVDLVAKAEAAVKDGKYKDVTEALLTMDGADVDKYINMAS